MFQRTSLSYKSRTGREGCLLQIQSFFIIILNPDQTYLILLVYHLIIYTCLKHISRASARLSFLKCYFKYDFHLRLCQYLLGNWRNRDRCQRIYRKDSYYVDIDIMRDRRNLHKNIASLPPRSFFEVKDVYYTPPTLQ